MRYLTLIIIATFCFVSPLRASSQYFQADLSTDSLALFKKKLNYIYQLYSESILTIIDEDVDQVEKYKAKCLITDLFETSNKKFTVRDYISDPHPKKLTARQFANQIYDVENKMPIYYRKFKLGDSIKITSASKGLSNRYSNLPASKRKDKYFKSFKGEMYFLEEFINSELGHNGYFDVKERMLLKKMSFAITHDENDQYILVMESIDIVDPRNKTYDFKKLKRVIKNSSNPWTYEANPNYAAEVISVAKRNGIDDLITITEPVLPKKIKKYSSLYEFKNPSFFNYMFPGSGFKKFGPKKSAKRNTIIYSSLFYGTALPAVYFKIKGDSQLDKIVPISTPREIAGHEEANRSDIKKARILGAAAAAVTVANAVHLIIKTKKRKDIMSKTKYRRFDLNFSYNPMDTRKIDGLAMSFGLTF